MPEPEDPAEATARLESALNRIAALARPALPEPIVPGPETEQHVDVAVLAVRLDSLIARLRCALSKQPRGVSDAGDGGRGDTGESAS